MTDHADLPIPDYDHLPENGLANRIRTLTADELGVLLDYEKAHANRLQIVMLIEKRRDAVRPGDAAPTGGDPAGAQPETPGRPRTARSAEQSKEDDMTRRDDARVEKALQGADFPADKQTLIDYAQTRDAGEETLQGMRALPDRTFHNLRDAVDAVPQEPEGDRPGGTDRVADV